MGAELLRGESLDGESVLKNLWHHQDAILCCSLKVYNRVILQKYFLFNILTCPGYSISQCNNSGVFLFAVIASFHICKPGWT